MTKPVSPERRAVSDRNRLRRWGHYRWLGSLRFIQVCLMHLPDTVRDDGEIQAMAAKILHDIDNLKALCREPVNLEPLPKE